MRGRNFGAGGVGGVQVLVGGRVCSDVRVSPPSSLSASASVSPSVSPSPYSLSPSDASEAGLAEGGGTGEMQALECTAPAAGGNANRAGKPSEVTHSLSNTLSHTLKHTLKNPQSHTQTHTLSRTHILTHTLSHTQTPAAGSNANRAGNDQPSEVVQIPVRSTLAFRRICRSRPRNRADSQT